MFTRPPLIGPVYPGPRQCLRSASRSKDSSAFTSGRWEQPTRGLNTKKKRSNAGPGKGQQQLPIPLDAIGPVVCLRPGLSLQAEFGGGPQRNMPVFNKSIVHVGTLGPATALFASDLCTCFVDYLRYRSRDVRNAAEKNGPCLGLNSFTVPPDVRHRRGVFSGLYCRSAILHHDNYLLIF